MKTLRGFLKYLHTYFLWQINIEEEEATEPDNTGSPKSEKIPSELHQGNIAGSTLSIQNVIKDLFLANSATVSVCNYSRYQTTVVSELSPGL